MLPEIDHEEMVKTIKISWRLIHIDFCGLFGGYGVKKIDYFRLLIYSIRPDYLQIFGE